MNKTLLRITFAIGLCLLFFQITRARLDPDLGWHLRVGQDILRTHEAPHFDTFSHTMPGYEWVDHEWFTDAGLAFVEEQHIWWLAVLLFTLLAVLPFVIWLWRVETLLQFFLVLLPALLMVNHIGVRPQIITFFFVFLLLESLNQRDRKVFWLIPLLFLAWSNLHGGFFLGLGVLFLFAIFSQSRLKFFFVLMSSFILTLINPYGLRIYREIFSVLFSAETTRYIAEWQPVFVQPALKDSLWLSVFLFFALLVFLAIFIFLAWRYRREYRLPVLATSIVLFLGYAKSLRLGPVFFASALPIFSQGADLLRQEVVRLRQGRAFSEQDRRLLHVLKLIAGGFLLTFALLLLFDPGTGHGYPVGAVIFLHQELSPGEIGNLFNEYAWGGYLAWHLPGVKVFIDGRMPHWASASGYRAMADYAAVFYPPRGEQSRFREVFRDHKIKTVLMEVPKCQGSEFSTVFSRLSDLHKLAQIPCQIVNELTQDGWQELYRDQTAVILHKM